MPYSDLLEPKFAKGQMVWFVSNTRSHASLPCPDCLGSKKWRVETPSGHTYEAACQRCCGGFVYARHDEVPSLAYDVIAPAVGSMVVTGVEIRSRGTFGEDDAARTTYWAGSGGRTEDQLFATEAEAMAVAEVEAAALNAKSRATPEALAQKNIGALRFEEARFDMFKNGLWQAWYAYRSLVEKLDEYLEGKETLSQEDTEYLKSDVRWEVEYRAKDERPLDRLVEAVRLALGGDASGLQSAFEALPEALKAEPKDSA
jgi:hypothetical protein